MRVKPKLPLFSPSFSHTQPHKRRKTRKRLCKVQKKKEILNRSFLDSTDESEEEGNNTINFTCIEFKGKGRRKKLHRFNCYREEDLKLSCDFLKKQRIRVCDDDYSTDEERLQNAINKLKSALFETVKTRRKKKARKVVKKFVYC